MRKFMKITAAVVVVFSAWLAWAMRDPAPVEVAPVQAPLPQDFIWGVSSSAWQSEGGDLDTSSKRYNDSHPEQDRYGTSVDFRHRYREDVALAKDLGVNTYRIGISWARVEPKKGQIDDGELAYYDDLILALRQAGIAPLITLDHFVYPGWVADQGGWSNPQTTADFVRYTTMIAQRYHQDVHHWITFNEEGAFMIGLMIQDGVGVRRSLQLRENRISAHRQTYDVIHALDPKAMVTSNIVWAGDHFGSWALQNLTDWLFLDRIEDKCDVIAIDYYSADVLRMTEANSAAAHWTLPPEPAGLYRGLKMVQARYPDKPVLIAETGMATQDGKPREDGVTRADVLRDTVYWTQRARDEGVNVVGYMVWSLTDNFEWGTYTPRFGLYTINVKTDPLLTRVATDGVPAYRDVIRAGGVGSQYRPVLPQK